MAKIIKRDFERKTYPCDLHDEWFGAYSGPDRDYEEDARAGLVPMNFNRRPDGKSADVVKLPTTRNKHGKQR
jgi:hypothetical protein